MASLLRNFSWADFEDADDVPLPVVNSTNRDVMSDEPCSDRMVRPDALSSKKLQANASVGVFLNKRPEPAPGSNSSGSRSQTPSTADSEEALPVEGPELEAAEEQEDGALTPLQQTPPRTPRAPRREQHVLDPMTTPDRPSGAIDFRRGNLSWSDLVCGRHYSDASPFRHAPTYLGPSPSRLQHSLSSPAPLTPVPDSELDSSREGLPLLFKQTGLHDDSSEGSRTHSPSAAEAKSKQDISKKRNRTPTRSTGWNNSKSNHLIHSLMREERTSSSSMLSGSPSHHVDKKRRSNSALMPGEDAKGPSPKRLSSAARLRARQKQVSLGKATDGYARYISLVPKEQRLAEHPRTPDAKAKLSKRQWDGVVRKWRRQLHDYDDVPHEDTDDAENTADSAASA